jgi:hypothetical protein
VSWIAVQDEGDRAVVVDLYLHVRTELSSGHVQSSAPEQIEEALIEPL